MLQRYRPIVFWKQEEEGEEGYSGFGSGSAGKYPHSSLVEKRVVQAVAEHNVPYTVHAYASPYVSSTKWQRRLRG